MHSWRFTSHLCIALAALAYGEPACSGSSIAHERQTIAVDGAVGALAFSQDGRFLAVDSQAGTLIWDIPSRRVVQRLAIGASNQLGAQVVNFSPDSRYLAVCGFAGEGRSDYAVFVYDTKTWQLSREIDHDTSNGIDTGQVCTGVLFSPDGKHLIRLTNQLANGLEYNLMVYDTSTWHVTSAIRTQSLEKGSDAESIHPPGRLVLQTLERPTSFSVDQGQAVYSKSGQYLALAGENLLLLTEQERAGLDTVQIFRRTKTIAQIWILGMPMGDLLRSIEGPTHSISWRPDGRRIAAAGNGKIEVFDPDSGAVLVTQESQEHCRDFGCAAGETNGRELVMFSADGRYLFEALDKQVEVWDGDHTKKWQSITAVPWCLAVSPDGRWLALGGEPKGVLPALLDLAVHPHGAGGRVVLYELK